MGLLLGIVATMLTGFVALFSATRDGLPVRYRTMLGVAAILTVSGAVYSYAEQKVFEKQVLGGDSYVYVTFESLDDASSKFVLKHAGDDYTAFDVNIDLFDLRRFEGINTSDPREITKNAQSIDRSTFPPEMSTSWINQFHPADCYGYWVALTYQRNRQLMSIISARRINGTWESATRVVTMDGEQQLIDEYATPSWDASTPSPTIIIRGPGSFHSLTPPQTC